jgi:hypothetical protein
MANRKQWNAAFTPLHSAGKIDGEIWNSPARWTLKRAEARAPKIIANALAA